MFTYPGKGPHSTFMVNTGRVAAEAEGAGEAGLGEDQETEPRVRLWPAREEAAGSG